ncbi:DUF1476 domain-containing protein [Bradyrhizobium sp.]|uniref:DUF1476 domain-containing protein n=1 Tax=Bradyrhizobium sp. TaxID=376 RepID=UPI002D253452|nr:DUF1476 domain-containing protein [Bradyrhizobium sp.]HZR76335.1 DUF1476 domain-containing protein [Bradyrhizobium sp.]
MTTFDKREEAFEKKFALEADLKFKAEARGNRLFALWAAEQLGLTGDAAVAYAKEQLAAVFAEGGETAVIRKITGDFAAKGLNFTPDNIRIRWREFFAEALAQLKTGG